MAYKATFKRYEMKYMLTSSQKARILLAMEPYMALDEYGRSTIRNIYFDTASFRLIRRSLEKPVYKEKLRIRSYGKADPDSTVFVELKRKYDSIVYKRRMSLPEREAMEWICGNARCPRDTQISREIDYFHEYYGALHPTVFLSYAREAFYAKDGGDFRVTFDDSILCRQEDLSLGAEIYGTALLPDDHVLMEIKCSSGIPLWMLRVLSGERIYKTTFSKYGTAYKNMILPRRKEASVCA